MTHFAKEILPVNLEDEMQHSYLEYAMSVIVGRALPDVRDGLKPVHRRVLYAMRVAGVDWNKPYKKSARIVGEVMGKYHPHGDTAIYDTIVRMAQPFSMRHMLIDGQGNFGSVDGDAPAAMRYTEIRMSKIAHALLNDLDKETIDFIPNYDNTEKEPVVLPSRIPTLLINGSSGIAVGMATNIPPHNLTETINACLAYIENEALTVDEIMQHLPGPDFPTAAIINGASGIKEAYETGRGKIYMRAKVHIEENENSGKQQIIVDELPYQVNKARLIKNTADLVRDKKIEGITEIRDESDKDGMRIVIEVRRGDVAEVLLNNLYKQTQMQTVFGINMVALVDGQPRTLGIKEILCCFVQHRRDVVTRRTLFELRKARGRAHVLEGLAVALANIDEVIALIKASKSPTKAKTALLAEYWQAESVTGMLSKAGDISSRPEDLADEYGLSEQGYKLSLAQAQAILELRLHRLTGLEQDKILGEYAEILKEIATLLSILSSSETLIKVVKDELIEIKTQFGDARRTEILQTRLNLSLEDLITEEDVVVTLSHQGYAKAQLLETYQAQKRGGKGKAATTNKNEDFINQLHVVNTHDTILCFSSRGRVYWLKVYELPQVSRTARGIPMLNLLPLEKEERINAILPIREYSEDQFIFMATAAGTVKKTPLTAFSNPRSNGIIAVELRENDELIGVALTDGEQDIMLFSDAGKTTRFKESAVRSTGRKATGVRGIRLEEGQKVISLIVVSEGYILTVSENGYGKRTKVSEFLTKGRGGKGMISLKSSKRNGQQVGAVLVQDDDEVMLITNGGTLVRTPVQDISVVGRNTQGVIVIRCSKGEKLIRLARIEKLAETREVEVIIEE